MGFITAKYMGGMRLNNIFVHKQPFSHGRHANPAQAAVRLGEGVPAVPVLGMRLPPGEPRHNQGDDAGCSCRFHW